MSIERQIWEAGYAPCRFNHGNETRIWNLPDYRRVELPNSGVPLYSIRQTPFYVGKIDEIIAAAYRLGAKIERESI